MTPALQRDVEKLVKTFAEELLGLYREAVIASLAMTGGAPRSEVAAPGRAPRAPRSSAAATPRKGASPRKGKPLVKSSPDEVEALSVRIIDYIKKSGKRPAAKDIQQALKVGAGPFQYALNKLKAEGRVRQVGQRRMARYETGAKAPAAAKKPRRTSAKKAPAAQATTGAAQAETVEATATPVLTEV